MGFLDEAMDSYRPPAAEDLEIVLPARREPKKEPADAAGEPQDLGQHGGAADGSQGPADTVSGAGGAASAPEPVPQRDEPDDGEHTDSTEQAVVARAAAAAAAAAASTGPADDEAEPADTADAPVVEDLEVEDEELALEPAVAEKPLTVKQALAKITGSVPREFQKTGFSAGGAEALTVTRFPVALVDRLRLSLAPAVGGDFAETMSSTALITAFLIAKTGVELDVDANTAVAVDVFRQVDPRLLAVEDKLDEVMSDVSRLAGAMKLSLKRIAETGDVADNLDFAMSFLVADRVAGLTTTDTDETNVDVTQKKVLVARESIRKRAKAQRTIERQRDGRRMA